ncbi:protein of unknown function [Taphrina deformans PYCC 5710]|uniref:Uncharacterized protein n=1 Tax=Taphrina deformans (strain PYCC 5710 / ATCC 11124 / CBS 356.35 / IMI 108563 / JCM 9778 / NBRC 8474) TaxID=1097556 RepID=R4XCD0_TAPDE|nr:protein of unknown function [Taphrina deformans PYCC 5710]|eukprot:CCG83241.1 protein of unknown function [Taphrina deformans PYCC 5710]
MSTHDSDPGLLVASSRSRPPAARKEPSVRDANTRADLGRLAREAEAAAYKARTAALNKNPVISTKTSETASAVAPARLDKPTRAEANSANIRADSRSPMVATGRDESRRPSDNSTARRIVEARSPVREKRPRSLTRRSSPDSNRSAPAIRRGLTAADIGRLEREKEAAAYKAKVLAEQKLQSKHTDSTSQIKPSNTHDRKTAPTSNAEARTSTPVVAKKQESPAVSAEVVIHVKSICPQLDSQLASLKAEYELLLKQDHKKQADLRVSMRQWAMLERESQREAHKSELAQLSLEATSAM